MDIDSFININFINIEDDIKIILKKYYNINDIKNNHFYIKDRILYIKEIDEFVYFDKILNNLNQKKVEFQNTKEEILNDDQLKNKDSKKKVTIEQEKNQESTIKDSNMKEEIMKQELLKQENDKGEVIQEQKKNMNKEEINKNYINNKNNFSNIDSKYKNILNNYYNLDNINYTINENIIIVKKDNVDEYIYFDEIIKKDLNIYYNLLYNGLNEKKNNIFMFQVGNLNTFRKMYNYLDVINKVDENCIFAFVENSENKTIINEIKNKIKNFIAIEVKNKGMDIGIFLISLLYLRENNLNYKNLIKIHTKTDDRFREHVLDNLVGSTTKIKKNFNLLNKQNIGMLNGTVTFDYFKNKSFFENHMYYLEYLVLFLFNESLDINKLEFAVGTFFYSKYDVFDVLNKDNIKILYNKLNDFNTLDFNWYKIFYNLKHKKEEYLINHWKKNKHKNFGNNLELQYKTGCLGMRDFMMEHALERFFGYLNKNKKYIMKEI